MQPNSRDVAWKTELPKEFGNYAVVQHLATGGMAEVYIARQTGLAGFERLVVLKRVRADMLDDVHAIAALLDEARLLATLNHPNIAQVYEIGRVNGSYFIAMEYVPGKDLRHVLERSAAVGTRVAIADAIYIAIQVCVALHHAHDKRDAHGEPLGIIHRDVSPSNVLISHDGAIKLCDFGIAKATTRANQTAIGTLKGKYGYMSPEQCRCLPLDRRSDVFSLGVLLYELTTVKRAYTGPNALAVLRRVVAGPPPPPSTRVNGYPAELERIVMRALANDPADRYATVQDLQLELEALARDQRFAVSQVGVARLMSELFCDGAVAAPRPAEPDARAIPDIFWAMMGSAADDPPPLPPAVTSRLTGSGIVESLHGPAALAPLEPAAIAPSARVDHDARPAYDARVADDARVGHDAPPAHTAPPALGPTAGTRRPPSAAWLALALLAGAGAAAATWTASVLERAATNASPVALRADADQLAGALELGHHLARVRASALATTPILRAAIETDAATVQDLATRDAVFTLGANEAVEVFQLLEAEPRSLFRAPAAAPAVAPTGGVARIVAIGDQLVVVAGAPVERATARAGAPMPVGEVVVSARVELAPTIRALADHTTWAALRGPGLDIQLVGLAGGAPTGAVATPLPVRGELGARELMLVAASTTAELAWLVPTQAAGCAAGALALLWYAARRWRAHGSRRAASAPS